MFLLYKYITWYHICFKFVSTFIILWRLLMLIHVVISQSIV